VRWAGGGVAAAAAAALAVSGAPAALAAPTITIPVSCSVTALRNAIQFSPSNAILVLHNGCTYFITSALPDVDNNLTIEGSNDTIYRVSGTYTMLTNEGVNLTINQLTMANANGHILSPGALLNEDGGSLTVTKSNFLDDDGGVGGAILNETGGSLTVSSSDFSHCDASSGLFGGGAIANGPVGTTTVSGSTFYENDAENGGAIGNLGGTTTVNGTKSVFTNNYADDYGGAIDNFLGSLNVSGATFSGNTTDHRDGGAIANFGTAATFGTSSFTGNYAGDDGGAISTATTLNLNSDSISGNYADDDGGGVYVTGGSTSLTTTRIFGNRAGGTGGGIRRTGGSVSLNYNSSVTLNVPNNCSGTSCF
jgi:predicted outer membrane repeat protein